MTTAFTNNYFNDSRSQHVGRSSLETKTNFYELHQILNIANHWGKLCFVSFVHSLI